MLLSTWSENPAENKFNSLELPYLYGKVSLLKRDKTSRIVGIHQERERERERERELERKALLGP